MKILNTPPVSVHLLWHLLLQYSTIHNAHQAGPEANLPPEPWQLREVRLALEALAVPSPSGSVRPTEGGQQGGAGGSDRPSPFCNTGHFKCPQPGCTGLSVHTGSQATFIFKRTSSSMLLFTGPTIAHSSAHHWQCRGQTESLMVVLGLSLLGVLSSAQGRGHQKTTREAGDPQELGRQLRPAALNSLRSGPSPVCCRSRLLRPRQARLAFLSTPLQTSLSGRQQCSI